MVLVKNGGVRPDPWRPVGDDEALPDQGPVLVSLRRWSADRESLSRRADPVGVRLESRDLAGSIGDDARRLALIAIAFPTFRDGRPYSTARLLRERYGFTGELRAVGNVLRDQFLFMARCGFDAFEVADDRAAAAWDRAIHEISVVYQVAADRRQPACQLRHRRSAAE